MIEDVIIDIDSFASVYEITLQAIPNQEFSTTINNEIFNFIISKAFSANFHIDFERMSSINSK